MPMNTDNYVDNFIGALSKLLVPLQGLRLQRLCLKTDTETFEFDDDHFFWVEEDGSLLYDSEFPIDRRVIEFSNSKQIEIFERSDGTLQIDENSSQHYLHEFTDRHERTASLVGEKLKGIVVYFAPGFRVFPGYVFEFETSNLYFDNRTWGFFESNLTRDPTIYFESDKVEFWDSIRVF